MKRHGEYQTKEYAKGAITDEGIKERGNALDVLAGHGEAKSPQQGSYLKGNLVHFKFSLWLNRLKCEGC